MNEYEKQLALYKESGLTMSEIIESIEDDQNSGFCISCGEESHGIEPDAWKYECEYCEAPCVYGSEELLIMFGG